MKRIFAYLCLVAAMLVLGAPAKAASTGKPVYHKFAFSDYSIVNNVSDNGKWAVLGGPTGEYAANGYARLVEVANTNNVITLASSIGVCDAYDVTDDGNIVVGDYNGQPAYYTRSTGQWTVLNVPEGYKSSGEVKSVTPDGHYAVGTIYDPDDSYVMHGVKWDLTTNTVMDVTLPPSSNTDEQNKAEENNFLQISADGRFIVAQVDWAYTWASAAWLIDTQNNTCVKLGFNKQADGTYVAANDSLGEASDPIISNNGKYVAAWARLHAGQDDGLYTMVYNTETGEYTFYTNAEDLDIVPAAIDNEGHVIGASPTATPVREWAVRVGQFWYDFDMITRQAYGQDFYDTTNYENTGTPYSISSDGKVIASMIDPAGGGAYIVEMPDNIATVCEGINLLDAYTATPASGTTMTSVQNIELLFEKEIVVKNKSGVTLYKNGTKVKDFSTVNVSSKSAKTLVLGARATTMDQGATYTVVIPAGALALKADESKTNDQIVLTYYGRGTQAVQIKQARPADHSQISKIDNTSNYITLTCDAPVQVTDGAGAELIRTADNTKIADLSVVAQDTLVGLLPAATQYLYDGQEYKVVLKAGSLTDLSGKGANEEFTLNYHGTFVRSISADNDSIFFDDFNDISNSLATWMRYEGDHNTPNADMQALEFDADNQPWNFSIRESSTSKDYCAGSTSMYDPAGQSDDWMVIPQINITDENYTLYFDAQSYRESKKDVLKVIVWPCEENINELTADIIAKIKEEGDVVFDGDLSPGLSEEGFDGDWEPEEVSLAEYAGKKVYICFWNNNEDQSMIFVDNVLVKNKMTYTLALTNAESVVNQNAIDIKGRLTVKGEDEETYNNITMTLLNAAGEEVSTYTAAEGTYADGDKIDFTFPQKLPLTVGIENKFTIKVQLDDAMGEVSSSVKDLTFEPVRRVVLEEFTGTTCVNCPIGILAIDHLKEIYGDKFLPVSIHTYTGDPLASGQSGYSGFLGLYAAPSGVIDRTGTIYYPMTQSPITGEYVFSFDGTLWSDIVADEMNTPTDVELTLGKMTINETAQTFTVPMTIKAALNVTNQNYLVFVTILEDSIISNQVNTFYNLNDEPNLGEWANGGKYANADNSGVVHNEVARACFGESYNGTSGFFPQALNAGEEASNEMTISLPSNVFELKNCKAVFMLIDGNSETNRVINAAQISFKDYVSTAISNIDADANKTIVARYNANGIQIDAPQKGINIVRYADGTTKKVVVK